MNNANVTIRLGSKEVGDIAALPAPEGTNGYQHHVDMATAGVSELLLAAVPPYEIMLLMHAIVEATAVYRQEIAREAELRNRITEEIRQQMAGLEAETIDKPTSEETDQ